MLLGKFLFELRYPCVVSVSMLMIISSGFLCVEIDLQSFQSSSQISLYHSLGQIHGRLFTTGSLQRKCFCVCQFSRSITCPSQHLFHQAVHAGNLCTFQYVGVCGFVLQSDIQDMAEAVHVEGVKFVFLL